MRLNPLFLLFLLLITPIASAEVVINPGVTFNLTNCSIQFSETLTFNGIDLTETSINFNDSERWSNLTIQAHDTATVNISAWDTTYPAENYSFNALSSGALPISFFIGTDLNNSDYRIKIDDSLNQTATANSTYTINFSWAEWSTPHDIQVLPGHISLISPSGAIAGNLTDYTNVNFQWADIDTDKYTIYVARDAGFMQLVEQSQIFTNTTSIYLSAGTYYWKVLPHDTTYGEYGSSDVFSFTLGSISSPGYANISVYNESSLEQINNFSVTLYNDTYTATKNTTAGYIEYNSTEILSGEYIAKISAAGYYPRWRVITSPENITAYLPSTSEDVALIDFSMIDYSNMFSYKTAYLKITKAGNASIIISDMEFDAGGVNSVYLINDINYQLAVYNSDYERDAGPYVPYGSADVSLIVGDIEFIPDTEAYGGFSYSIQNTNTSISLSWVAPAGSLNSMFLFTVTDTATGATVYSIASAAPQGLATYTFTEAGKQYLVELYASTSGGILDHSEYIRSAEDLLDIQISDSWMNMLSIFLLLLFGLTFGYRSASIGAFLTASLAGGLYALGALRLELSIISFIVVLGILALFRGRNN